MRLLIPLLLLILTCCKDEEILLPTFQERIEGQWGLFSYAKVDCIDESRNVSPILAEDGCVDFIGNICGTMHFDPNGVLTLYNGDNEPTSTNTYTTIEDSSIIFVCGNTNLCTKIYYEDEKLTFLSDNSGCNDEYVYSK